MCTSIAFRRKDFYFGRNLDVEFSYNEKVVITPRGHLFSLKNGEDFRNEYALIGIAAEEGDYPLYYEAANEKGLSAAGLNFPGNACYLEPEEGKTNITPFEFIPWILGQAKSVCEARTLLADMNMTNIFFTDEMPLSPLHFMLSDRKESIVVEPVADGLKIYDNPYDVMTNNPPFEYHKWNMQNYLHLSPRNSENRFSQEYELKSYAVGMGAGGLPGDASSASRFIRAAFNLTNSVCDDSEEACVTQFFHILDSVAMVKGATLTDKGKDDITRYSCCINADKGIFYYKTYGNSQITAVSLHSVNLTSPHLYTYPLIDEQQIWYAN